MRQQRQQPAPITVRVDGGQLVNDLPSLIWETQRVIVGALLLHLERQCRRILLRCCRCGRVVAFPVCHFSFS
jgi:hypothetical protein